MTTEIITLGEYRKNLSSLWKKASEKNIKYLVLVHGKPTFEVQPVTSNIIDKDWTEYTEENHQAWLEAEKELKNGEAIEIDLEQIKNTDDFLSFLKSNHNV